MTTIYVIIAEVGDGQDFRYDPRFYFATEAEALALSARLNQAATSTFSMDTLPTARRGPLHDVLRDAALAALQSLDPDAVPTVRYVVKDVSSFTAPSEGAPANQAVALFRTIRDFGA